MLRVHQSALRHGCTIELIGGELADDIPLIWHADRCRRTYLTLLPTTGGDE